MPEPSPPTRDAPVSEGALITFFALTYAWSWTLWLLAPRLQSDAPLGATAMGLVGGFGPSLAALVVVNHQAGWGGLRHWLKCCIRRPAPSRWMALAFFFPLIVMSLAAAAHVALGGTLPRSPAADHPWLVAANFFLVFLVGGPVGEELGWRGYALPAMQRRWGWRIASLMLGGAWALWHLPLFFVKGSAQSHLPMGLYALSTVASSVLFAWLYNRTMGSVLPVLVLHTAVNAWTLVIPVMVMADGSNLRPFQMMVSILVFVAMLLLLHCDDGSEDQGPVPAGS